MNRSVFWALVRKDLYLMRGLMIAAPVAALIATVVMGLGKVGFAVGGVLFLTTSMASAIFIAAISLTGERKEQSRLFTLSLPISGNHHDLAKLLAAYLAYVIPWLALTLIAVLVFLLHAGSDRGMVVYAAMLQGFVLMLFSCAVAAFYVIKSEALYGVAILTVNIAFTLFMIKIDQPDVIKPLSTDVIVWTPFAQAMLAGEALTLAAALAFVLSAISRHRDHV